MKYLNVILNLIILILTSSCSRYVNYIEKTFNQACQFEVDLKKARSFIRSSKSYDQFTTVGLFDAIWFNDYVEKTYMKIKQEHSSVHNNNLEKLKSSLNDNKNFITFYLLLSSKQFQDDVLYTHFDGITYNQDNINWKIYLEINNNIYSPVTFSTQDIDPEFSLIFKESANRYRDFYVVRFEKEVNGNKIISEKSKQIKLVLKTTKYIIPFCWSLN